MEQIDIDINEEWEKDKERCINGLLWDMRKIIGMCIKEICLSNTDDTLIILAKVRPIIKQQDIIEEKVKKTIDNLVERLKEKQ